MPESNVDTELMTLVRDAAPHLARRDQSTEAWLSRLEELRPALHQMLARLLDLGDPTGPELVGDLWPFWWDRGHMAEGRVFLEQAHRLTAESDPAVCKGLGTIAFRQGDLDTARAAFDRRLELVESTDDRRALAEAYADLARIALRSGDIPAVKRFAEAGYAAAEGLDSDAIRIPLHMRAAAARMEGQLDAARVLYLESRALNDAAGNDMMVAAEDHNLVHVALHSGDREEAERRFRASSAWIAANDNAYLRPYSILDAGILALHDGAIERAAHLIAAAQRMFEESGMIPDPDDQGEIDRALAQLHEQLGIGFDAARQAGHSLTMDEVFRRWRSD